MADNKTHTDPKQNQMDRKPNEATGREQGSEQMSSTNREQDKGAVGDREWDKKKSGEGSANNPTGQKPDQNPTGQTQGQNPTGQTPTSETGEPGRARSELDSAKSDKTSR